VSFRGTHNKPGWAINMMYQSTTTDIGECAQGWYKNMDSVYDEIVAFLQTIPGIKSMRLWVCGHSKGSAESQDFAVAVNSILPFEMWHGIGSPRPFKKKTAEYHSMIFKGRMFYTKNNNDVVCIVPPDIFGYAECGQMIYIDSDGNVRIGVGFWKGFVDGFVGFFKKQPKELDYDLDNSEGHYFDAGDDHKPHLYVNAFMKAAGCDFRFEPWADKFM
jgi:hypothetical protein